MYAKLTCSNHCNSCAIVNVTSTCVLETFTSGFLYQDLILFAVDLISACYPDDEYLEVRFYLISFTQNNKKYRK